MKDQLLQLAIDQMPAIIAGLKALFKRNNPDAPEPTDQEVLDAARDVFTRSLAIDEAWIADHPNWNA